MKNAYIYITYFSSMELRMLHVLYDRIIIPGFHFNNYSRYYNNNKQLYYPTLTK